MTDSPRSPFHGFEQIPLREYAERAYLDLAERARARHAYTDAERLYSRALEQRGEAGPVERAAAYRGRGLMRSRIGRHHQSLSRYQAMVRSIPVSKLSRACQPSSRSIFDGSIA